MNLEHDQKDDKKDKTADHSGLSDSKSNALNSVDILRSQAAHIEAFKKVGDEQYKVILDCSGEIFTSDGKVVTAGHCSPEDQPPDLFRITDGKGKVHYATDSEIDRKHDVAILDEKHVQPNEYQNISLGGDNTNPTAKGADLTANVYSTVASGLQEVHATAGENKLLNNFAAVKSISPGQDASMLERSASGKFVKGNSGAMAYLSDSKEPFGIVDYSDEKTNEATLIPIKYVRQMLSNDNKTVKD